MAASPTVESFLEHVVQAFEASLETTALLRLSTGLRQQYREAFRKKGFGMTPSYLYNMPAGTERGTYVSMDIGGTVLKLALVRLNERQPDQGSGASTLLRLKTWTMDNAVKDSGSVGVYDWVASRLKETLFGPEDPWAEAHAVPSIGLAWSLPIECELLSPLRKTAQSLMDRQIHLDQDRHYPRHEQGPREVQRPRRRRGRRSRHRGVSQEREWVPRIIAFRSQRHTERYGQGFEVTVDAIVHDLSGNVLADAYRSDAPCLSLIYGTGVNAALDFPAGCVAPEKFPRGTQTAEGLPASVIMNTELSTYGKHVLPTTTWDDQLNGAHAKPDMQPLEYLVGGRYLGEIVRLIVVDAVHETGLFGGHLPSSLSRPYSLDTALMADIERYGNHNADSQKVNSSIVITLPVLTSRFSIRSVIHPQLSRGSWKQRIRRPLRKRQRSQRQTPSASNASARPCRTAPPHISQRLSTRSGLFATNAEPRRRRLYQSWDLLRRFHPHYFHPLRPHLHPPLHLILLLLLPLLLLHPLRRQLL